jgi:hypothetical protein
MATLWCNTHQRRAERCKVEGGIMMPCQVIDLDEVGIELVEEMKSLPDVSVEVVEGPTGGDGYAISSNKIIWRKRP